MDVATANYIAANTPISPAIQGRIVCTHERRDRLPGRSPRRRVATTSTRRGGRRDGPLGRSVTSRRCGRELGDVAAPAPPGRASRPAGPTRLRRRSTRAFAASSHSAPCRIRTAAWNSSRAVSRPLRRVTRSRSERVRQRRGSSAPRGRARAWTARRLPVLVGEPGGDRPADAVHLDARPRSTSDLRGARPRPPSAAWPAPSGRRPGTSISPTISSSITKDARYVPVSSNRRVLDACRSRP